MIELLKSHRQTSAPCRAELLQSYWPIFLFRQNFMLRGLTTTRRPCATRLIDFESNNSGLYLLTMALNNNSNCTNYNKTSLLVHEARYSDGLVWF